MWIKWLVLKKGLIADKSFPDEHAQRVVGFWVFWSLLKAQGFGSWMSNNFCQKDHERHLLRDLLSLELKKSFYIVFYWSWKIFDIVVFKTLKLLGHAWVVFDDVNVATNAFCQMQGFPFYDKHMVSNFVILPFTLEYVM